MAVFVSTPPRPRRRDWVFVGYDTYQELTALISGRRNNLTVSVRYRLALIRGRIEALLIAEGMLP
jgi:hypothetical protein